MMNDENKISPAKLKITIEDSKSSLPGKIFKDLLKKLLAEPKNAQAILPALFVITLDKIAGKRSLLLSKADFFNLYRDFITNDKMLTENAKEDSRAIAVAMCQPANLADLYEIYETIHGPYIESMKEKIGETYRQDSNLLVHLQQIGREQLRHEEGLNSFARTEVYGFFDKIAAITLTDYLQQLNMFEKLENHIKDFNKNSAAYLVSKEIIIWFEKSGLTFDDNQTKALQKCRAALDAVLKTATHDKGPSDQMLKELLTSLEKFKNGYRFEFQLSIYAVPQLVNVNQLYNYGLMFNASLPAQQLPVPLRAKSYITISHHRKHFEQKPEDQRIFNTDIVNIPEKPKANPQDLNYFSIAKVIQDMNQRGFAGFILDWHDSVWEKTYTDKGTAAYDEDQEKKVEKLRIANLITHYDAELLIADFEKLYAQLKNQNIDKKLKILLTDLHEIAEKFLKLAHESNLLKAKLATAPSPELFGTFMGVKIELTTLTNKFKLELEKLNLAKISELITATNSLDITVFGNSTITIHDRINDEVVDKNIEIQNFYGNTAIHFLSFLQRKQMKQPMWSTTNASAFGSRVYRNITTVLQEPVQRAGLKYTLRKEIALDFARLLPLKALQQATDQQTKKIESTILELYLKFCEFNPTTDKKALESLTSSNAKPTKEQKAAFREVKKSVEKFRQSLEDDFVKGLSVLIHQNPNDQNIPVQLQTLFCHVIATNNKNLYKELFKLINKTDAGFWEPILSQREIPDNHTPIHCAVFFNRSTILKDILKKLAPQGLIKLANLKFTSEDGSEEFSLLSLAASLDNIEAMKVLLANGAKLDTKNGKNQRSALEIAVKFANANATRVLLTSYLQGLENSTKKENLLVQLKQEIANTKQLYANCVQATRELLITYSQAFEKSPTPELKRNIANAKQLCANYENVRKVLDAAEDKMQIKEGKKVPEPKTTVQVGSGKTGTQQTSPSKSMPKKTGSSKSLVDSKSPLLSQKSVKERVADYTQKTIPSTNAPKVELKSPSPKVEVTSKSNAQLIDQFSGTKKRLKEILDEVLTQEKPDLAILKSILPDQNRNKLWHFVIGQINQRKESDFKVTDYQKKNLIPVLDIILSYLMENPPTDPKAAKQHYTNIYTIADIYSTYASCKKFIDNLNPKILEPIEKAAKRSRTEDFSESGSDVDSIDSGTLSDSGNMTP